MRILVWFVMGFGGACCLASSTPAGDSLLPALAALLPVPVLLLTGRRRKGLVSAALVLLGCAVGLCWCFGYRSLYLLPLETLDGREQHVCFTAADYAEATDYGTAVDGKLTLEGKSYSCRAYLEPGMTAGPGDEIRGVFRIRITTKNADSSYYSGKGVFVQLYQQGALEAEPASKIPVYAYPAALRLQLKQILTCAFPEDTAPFARALLLGDTRDLDYETETAFRVSGIRHIVAVSGLHISILYGMVCLLTFRRRWLTALVAAPVLLLFAAVAGFSPSVVRAGIMVFLMILAGLFDREYDPATALAASVLVMLLCNPMAAGSASLQMSVSCVAGILLFAPGITGWLKERWRPKKKFPSRLWASVCAGIAVSLSATVMVTPLCALYFGTVSLVSPVTNLLTLWAVSLVFYGIMSVCLLQLIWPVGAGLLASGLSILIRYVTGTAKIMAGLPAAAVYTRSVYIAVWLIFGYLLLAVFFRMEKRKPAVPVMCAALGLCLALTASWLEPLMASVRITMLDVGQGQAIVLQSRGSTFLVDCGGDSDTGTADIIAETLLSQGISRLDGIVLTHYDADHAGALEHLLTRVDTELLLLPDTCNDMAVPETEGQILWVWEDLELRAGDAKLVIYGPVYSGYDNENSLCVLFDTEKCDILITGDRSAFGERMLMRRTVLPDVDILVAGHHGAADATSEALLQQVQPETVLISASENNIYGHPAAALLERLDAFGCRVYRTDRDGTITIRR